MTATTHDGLMTLNTRRITIAGILGAIAIVLGATRLGFIPVPNVTGNATIMHIPAIIGAVLEGPLVGVLAGLIFGVYSWLQADSPIFANPVIAILPRVLIGVMAWLVYRSMARFNQDLAAVAAGVFGTLTNTVCVLGLAVAFGLLPVEVIVTIIPQAIAELVIAAVLTPLVVRGVNRVRSGLTTAKDDTPRDESYH